MPRRKLFDYASIQAAAADGSYIRGRISLLASGSSLACNLLGLLLFWGLGDNIFSFGRLFSLLAGFVGLVVGFIGLLFCVLEIKSAKTKPDYLPAAWILLLLSSACLGFVVWLNLSPMPGGAGLH
jgi:UDP-N-acetylmuramyl pentapeptide phosphotransferase/UDP-N-acetylglucosamine-1-phosphate transferase